MTAKTEEDAGGEGKKHYSICVSTARNTELCINRPLLVDDPSFARAEHDFVLKRHRQQRKRTHLQLSSDSERIKYRAVNFGERSAATLPYHYAVALIDTERHTAELFDAELFVTRKIIKNLEAVDADANENENENTLSRDTPLPQRQKGKEKQRQKEGAARLDGKKEEMSEYQRSKALLGESFGTKRTKKALSSLERNRIDMDQLASEAAFISKNIDSSIVRIGSVHGGAADASAEDDTSSATITSPDNFLPPHNPKTHKVEQIYRIRDLIPEKAYLSLDVSSLMATVKASGGGEEALAGAKAELGLVETVESRIRAMMMRADRVTDDTLLTHRLRCLVYLNHLVLFRELNESKINGNLAEYFPMANGDLLAALLENFTEAITTGNGKRRYKIPAICRDRIIAHICILVLTLDEFRVNVARLSTALRISTAKTGQYLKALGCVLQSPGQDEPSVYVVPGSGRELLVKIAVLRAPLTILASKGRGDKARRK